MCDVATMCVVATMQHHTRVLVLIDAASHTSASVALVDTNTNKTSQKQLVCLYHGGFRF